MSRRLLPSVLCAAVLLAACSQPEEVDCMPGWGTCDGICVDLRTDAQNCGACGNACDAGQTCSGNACVTDCAANLRAPIPDRWGATWDSLERPVATLADAAATCEAFGARLPTATEIHRVSATQTSDVGQGYQTNALWTRVPANATDNFTLKLSDGSTTSATRTAKVGYRCVCAPPMPEGFDGYACNGPPDAPCVALSGGNAGYAMDANDRAALNAGGAAWECAFSGGQLPSVLTYAEAILDGAPNGSGKPLIAADAARYDLTSTVKWTGTETSWAIDTNLSYEYFTGLRSFRCVGRTAASTPNPGRPESAIVGATAKATEVFDRPSASWSAAHDVCRAVGGHLPFLYELVPLIQQGAPGSDVWLWTADQAGYSGGALTAGALKWSGVNEAFIPVHPANVTWIDRAGSYVHRCVLYPVNAAYPAPTGCKDGCFEIILGGTGGAKLWLDKQDRSAATFISAVGICRSAGGHLATERDYTDAIRSGLPNGSGAFLHAADIAYASPMRNMLVKWSNLDPNFNDAVGTYATWSANLLEQRAFRCVWTNELR